MGHQKKEFFIGWQDNMPPENKSYLRKVIISLFILIPIIVISVVWLQKPFNNHIFQFGNIMKVSGTYYAQPIPILIADEGILPDAISKELMLVGFGKFGAEGIMNELDEVHGDFNGKKITLAGKLIAGDGKSLLELTKKTKSFISINEHSTVIPSSGSYLEEIVISGEILDPKCYFGVMKPGEGKIHKSCATRCISGGIPPIIKSESADQISPAKYFVILDENGNKMNKELLPFVAEKVNLKGKSIHVNGWDFVYINLEDIVISN